MAASGHTCATLLSVCAAVLLLCIPCVRAWATIGCYPSNRLPWTKRAFPVRLARGQRLNADVCEQACVNGVGMPSNILAQLPLPLFALAPNGCYCGARVPQKRQAVADWRCKGSSRPRGLLAAGLNGALSETSGNTDESYTTADSTRTLPPVRQLASTNIKFFTVYMGHAIAKEKSCRVLPINQKNWLTTWGHENVKWSKDGRNATLTMKGNTGAGIKTKDLYLYGIMQADIKADTRPGAITAFYSTDEGRWDPNAPRCQHEIDIEFLNMLPCKARGCLWFNYFTRGRQPTANQREIPWKMYGRDKIRASPAGARAGRPFTIGSTNTYMVWWQPRRICFYVNDKKLHCKNGKSPFEYKMKHGLPSTPQTLSFSLWSNCGELDPTCNCQWGGCIKDQRIISKSSVSNALRVVCQKKPMKSRFCSAKADSG